MKAELLVSGLLAAALLTGYNADAKSLDWSKTHDKERSVKYEECRKSSGPRGTKDCRYAMDATVHGGSFTKTGSNKSC